MFKSHVNLFSYIVITITKWNYLNANLNWSKENETNLNLILFVKHERTRTNQKYANEHLVIASVNLIKNWSNQTKTQWQLIVYNA